MKGANTLSKFMATLDSVGNPTQVVTSTETITYTYDSLDRVTRACYTPTCTGGSLPSISYTYDPVGNRRTEVRSTGTTTYTYNTSDQLTQRSGPSGTVNYAYDLDGNETAAGSRTFVYDLASRLASTTSGNTTITYTYDGQGKRLKASSGNQASAKTNFLWDPNAPLPLLAVERDGNNALLRRYIYGADLISMTTGGSTFYYHPDGLGTISNLTSSTGATQWTYTYEPFGTARTTTKNNNQAPSNPIQFTGQYLDSATGLYHLRARQYDPTIGRFLQPDPRSAPLRHPYVGTYAYAENRPTLLTDPSGCTAESPLLVPPSVLDPVSQAQAGGFKQCVRNCYMQNLQCRANAQDAVDLELCEMILKGCVEECRRRYGTRTVTSADASLILNSLTFEQILESLTQTNVSPYVG